MFIFVAVHSTVRGPALGGCRLWTYDDARLALRDVLRLSEGMTYKAACAGLAMGGGKGVIMARPGVPLDAVRRRAALEDFGDAVAALDGEYLTAEDVGVTPADMEVVATRTAHVTGRAGGSGDPSPWTALGVQAAIEAACEVRFGTPELSGRSASVVGLGHVGLPLARGLAAAGCSLVVADLDPDRRADAEALGARWATPDEALTARVDILAPCALGGQLDHSIVPRLRCAIIAGAANNQLADASVADALDDADVLWAPDFVCNAGGIVNIGVELRPEGYDPEQAGRDVAVIGKTTRTVLAAARARGTTPLAAAMALAAERLAPPG